MIALFLAAMMSVAPAAEVTLRWQDHPGERTGTLTKRGSRYVLESEGQSWLIADEAAEYVLRGFTCRYVSNSTPMVEIVLKEQRGK